MSDADPEGVTVSTDGITVRKTVDTEQFQTLAVVLELASGRDEAARVQLLDQIPSAVSMDDVGFHPEYGAEHWSVEDGAVAFERDLEPDGTYTTIYGIRGFPEEDVDALLGEPAIDLLDLNAGGLVDVIDEDRSAAVRGFISGEADLPGLEEELAADAEAAAAGADREEPPAPAEPTEGAGPAAAEAATEPADAPPSDPAPSPEPEPVEDHAQTPEAAEASNEEPAPAVAPTDADDGEEADRKEVRVPLTGGVVRVLIKELREGDVDPEDRRLLRDELLDTEGSTEARLAHLQQRVSDLEAYADALEAFIDEEGTAEAVLEELREETASLEREVRSVDDRLDEVLESVDATEDRLDTVAGDLGTVETRTEILGDRLEDAEDDITGVDERVDDVGARFDRLSTDLDGIDGRVDEVDDRVTAVDGRIDEVDDEVAAVRDELRADLEALETDLEELGAFRDRLSSVFGTGGAGPAVPDEDEADDE